MKINKLQQGNIIRTTRGNFIRDKNGVLHVLNSQGDVEQLLDDEVVVKPKPKLSAFTKATIGSAMASNPAIMQASGWKLDNRGNWKQERTKGSDELANNLFELGMTAVTAPTLVNDIGSLYTMIRHPKETIKGLKDTYNFIRGRLRHPTYQHYYHGSPKPFDIKHAWMGTANDMGLHAGSKATATRMSKFPMETDNSVVYDFWVPRPKLEVIDKGGNDVTLFMKVLPIKARRKPNFLFGNSNTKKFNNALKLYNADPEFVPIETLDNGITNYLIHTNNDVELPLREINYPNMPEHLLKKFDTLIERHNKVFKDRGKAVEKFIKEQPNASWKQRDKIKDFYNKQLADINKEGALALSEEGHKVISYLNYNRGEGPGKCIFITDPSVIQFLPNPNWSNYVPFKAIGLNYNLFNNK